MPAADNEAEEIFQFLPLRQGELQRIGLTNSLGLPVDAILGGDTAGLAFVGFAAGLLGRLRLGLGRGGRLGFGRSRGGHRTRGRRGGDRSGGLGRGRSLGNGGRRGGRRLHLNRGSVADGGRRLGEARRNLRDRLGRFEADASAGRSSGGAHRRQASQAQAAGFAGLG